MCIVKGPFISLIFLTSDRTVPKGTLFIKLLLRTLTLDLQDCVC